MIRQSKPSRQAWNKDLAVGQKKPLLLDEITTIETHLVAQKNWHDLALLSFGLDTMFRSSDLLSTQVWNLTYPNGHIRSLIPRRQKKTKHSVFPVLTEPTKRYLAHWLKISQKQPEDFVFTRTKPRQARAISRSHYADLVKAWAEMLGREPSEYSTHSIRRSKPVHMYGAGEDIALISRLLGHKSIAVTVEYLGITQAKAEEASLRYPMMKGQSVPVSPKPVTKKS